MYFIIKSERFSFNYRNFAIVGDAESSLKTS